MILRLRLIKSKLKPTIKTRINDLKLSYLLDTGAGMSVWCNTFELFEKAFPNKEKVEGKKFLLGGFGGRGDITDIYMIPDFTIEDAEGNKIVYKKIYCVIRTNMSFGCDFILSCSLFGKMDYKIINRDMSGGRFLELEYDNDIYEMGLKYRSLSNEEKAEIKKIDMKLDIDNLVKETYIFTQKDA